MEAELIGDATDDEIVTTAEDVVGAEDVMTEEDVLVELFEVVTDLQPVVFPPLF